MLTFGDWWRGFETRDESLGIWGKGLGQGILGDESPKAKKQNSVDFVDLVAGATCQGTKIAVNGLINQPFTAILRLAFCFPKKNKVSSEGEDTYLNVCNYTYNKGGINVICLSANGLSSLNSDNNIISVYEMQWGFILTFRQTIVIIL